MNSFIRAFKNTVMPLMICILAVGCATKPNAQLEQARTVYDQVLANPAVLNAPGAKLYLDKSYDSLAKAGKASTTQKINHIAYLAEKQALLALEIAERKKAEKQLMTLERDKTHVMLEKRALDAARARADADRALAEIRNQSLENARAREENARAREETALALAEARAKAREAEEAIAKAKKLEKELSELQAKKTDRGLVFTLGDVLFSTGKAKLLPSSTRNLDKLVKFLKQYPSRKVLVEGHTDSTGSDALNMQLSERRAYAVRLALLEKGIDSNQINSNGYGESRPIADNSSRMGRQQNRRVEIVVLNES